jgi:hypothetical protein
MAPLDANILVPVILFILLSPGLLLAIPAGSSYWILRSVFPQYY